ncbi:hypothetical protein ACFE04_004612 [Oxalis oulophora]
MSSFMSHDSSNPLFMDYPPNLKLEDKIPSSSNGTLPLFYESSKSDDFKKADVPITLPLSLSLSPPLVPIMLPSPPTSFLGNFAWRFYLFDVCASGFLILVTFIAPEKIQMMFVHVILHLAQLAVKDVAMDKGRSRAFLVTWRVLRSKRRLFTALARVGMLEPRLWL